MEASTMNTKQFIEAARQYLFGQTLLQPALAAGAVRQGQ